MPTVTQTIRFEGQDAATATANKVKAAVQGIGGAAETSAKQTAQIAEKTGDLERGFMGLKDIIGGVAEGPLAAVADRMGGIEAVIKGFGPGMGALGVAIAGVAAGASLVYDRLETIRKAGVQGQIDALEKARADKELLAERYGLTREQIGLEEKQFNLKQTKLDIDKQVTAVADAERELLDKKLTGETEGLFRKEQQLKSAKAALEVMKETFDFQKRQEAADEKKAATNLFLADTSAALVERTHAIELMTDATAKTTAKLAMLDERRATLEREITLLGYQQEDVATRTLAGMQRLLGLKAQQRELDIQERDLNAQAAADESARASARAAAARAASEAQRKRDEERRKIIDDMVAKKEAEDEQVRKQIDDNYRVEKELFDKLTADRKADDEAALKAQEAIRKAKIAATEDPQQRLNLERYDIEARKVKELAAIKESLASADTKALQEAEVQMRAAVELGAAEVRAKQAVAAATAKATDENRKLVNSVLDIVAPAAQAAQAVGGPGLSNAFAAAVESGRKLANNWDDTKGRASGIIGAVGNVAAAVVDGEKQKAAVLGVMEAAQAVALSFVPGKQAEAAGHAAAALLYGGIATGLVGGSTGGAGAAPGGFGAQAQATPVAGGQGMGGGGMTVVNNYNAPLGTRYEIGKSVAESAKAAKAWAKVPAGV